MKTLPSGFIPFTCHYFLSLVDIHLQDINYPCLLYTSKYRQLAESDNNVIFGGRLGNYKYLSLIHIYYVMCGIGPEKEELEQYVKEHHLEKNIQFAGIRALYMKFYSARIALFCRRSERDYPLH